MNYHHERFLGKAQAYAAGRPDYPSETLTQIIQTTGFNPTATVYDLGAGTGIFTQRLLDHFNHVHIVEPNPEMLAVAQESLPQARITAHHEPAESFIASPNTIDLITAAQAFHWFDHDQAKQHWQAVLKPTGYVALIWNENYPSTPFGQDLVSFLTELNGKESTLSLVQNASSNLVLDFFKLGQLLETERLKPLTQQQLHNLVLSRSYAPLPNHPDYESVIQNIDQIFNAHQVDNLVQLPNITKLFIGQI